VCTFLIFLKSSINKGITLNKSPTIPKVAILNIGASRSLLMAIILLEVCIPTKCWIAPEIPQAIYNSGATVFPDWPTC